MVSEQVMLKATFAAALLVLLMTTATALVSWLAYFDRQQVQASVIELQKRVAALEAAHRRHLAAALPTMWPASDKTAHNKLAAPTGIEPVPAP